MKHFHFQRWVKFLEFEFRSQRSQQLLPVLASGAVYFLWCLYRLMSGNPIDSWGDMSLSIGLLLSIDLMVSAHRRDIDRESAAVHLLLPVTHLERFLGRWLLTSILPFAAQLVSLTILANVLGSLSASMGTTPWKFLHPDRDAIEGIGNFLVLHSVFFTGGIFFRRYALLKTLITVSAYLCADAILLTGLIGLGYIQRSSIDLSRIIEVLSDSSDAGSPVHLTRIAWVTLLPLLLYAAAYFRAVENEAR